MFTVRAIRFEFIAIDAVSFPPGKAGNVLRGAFGSALRQVADESAYARIFAPKSNGTGPSGFADLPRPFVFRGRHLDGCSIPPGHPFHFDLNLFDLDEAVLNGFVLAFTRIGQQGLGPGRGRARLVNVCQEVFRLDLSPDPNPVGNIRVEFLSPTELKSNQTLAARPEFGVLFGRIRDRIGNLRAAYGEGLLDIDFRAMAARASQIAMTRCEIHEVAVQRSSSRTGQTHSLGGFTGFADYQGDLAEFAPYLRAAQWTGVGRHTAFGKGEIRVLDCTPPDV